MPHPDDTAPAFEAPPLACDAHFHVFGPAADYPYGTDLRYPPPLAPLAEYRVVARRLGIERMVFVQPSAYGRDNACMLDTIARGNGRYKGVAVVANDVTFEELQRMKSLGVLGVAWWSPSDGSTWPAPDCCC